MRRVISRSVFRPWVLEIEEITETDQQIGAEVATTLDLQEQCMMSPVRTAGKRHKCHLNLPKVGPFTAKSAFQSTGLREEDFDSPVVEENQIAIDSFSLTRPKTFLRVFFGLNVCKNHHCVSCCFHTEMLLLDEDIERITGLGYEEKFFAGKESQTGFKVLKNSRAGRCVFHDGTQCTIYENRPKGCELYPIIFSEDSMSAVKDDLCPYREEFKLSAQAKLELSEDVYPRLLAERLERKSERR